MRSRRRGATAGSTAGALIGAAVTVLLVMTGVLPLPARADPEAPGRLLAAWQRHRMATFTLEGEVTRVRPDGGRLTTYRTEVQRPPDHVIKEHGTVSGQIDGQRINCSASPGGGLVCGATGSEAPDWVQTVAHELAVLRGYVAGPDRLYDVTEQDGCFELDLVRYEPDSPYGLGARLCFDEATGALRDLRRKLEGGIVEERVATYLSPSVDPADLSAVLSEEHLSNAKEPEPMTAGTVPTAIIDPLVAELAALDADGFFARARNVSTGAEIRAVIQDAIRRMEAGEISINDPRWRDDQGAPIASAPPLVRVLLEEGYRPAGS